MSTDTFSDLETRLRSDLPRLADVLVASEREPEAEHDHLVRLEPHDDDGRRGRRRGLIPVLAVAAVVLVLLGVVLAVRGNGDHDAKPVDVGPAPVEAGWAPMATSPLSAREAAVSVWTGTEVIIWGGRIGNMALLDGAAYDPATDTWRAIASNSWGHPGAHAAWTGTEMVVLAKTGGAAYDPASDTWHDLPRLDDSAGSFLAPVWTGDRLVGVGLNVAANDTSVSLTASTLAADGSVWNTGASVPVSDSVFDVPDYSVVWTGTEAVVWDGVRNGWAYDPSTDAWRTLPELTTPTGTATVQSLAVSTDEALYVVTQQLGSASPMIGVMRSKPDGWESSGSIDGRSIDAHATVAGAGGRIAVLPIDSAAFVVDPAAPGVGAIAAPAAPGVNQSIVWTGDQLVVWGGADGAGEARASGWRWHPGG